MIKDHHDGRLFEDERKKSARAIVQNRLAQNGCAHTEPAIAVARATQIKDRVADHPWDELEDPCPL